MQIDFKNLRTMTTMLFQEKSFAETAILNARIL